jgi:hypothetical protein
MKKSPKHVERFISEVLAIEAEDAQTAKQLGFMARAMVIATLPHSKPEGTVFQRQNGHYTLTMTANPQYGLPYGSLPRWLLAWITTTAVQRKSKVLLLGDTLTEFMNTLGLSCKGGVRGDITRLKNQMLRLFTSHISCTYHNASQGMASGDHFSITRSFQLWWKPIHKADADLSAHSSITLASDFFDEIIQRPVPIDFRAMKSLRKSPLQMDIYVWLTYRFASLHQAACIPWPLLKMQFGSNYGEDAQGTRDFKKNFIKALHPVLMIYSDAQVVMDEDGLKLHPSATHIKPKKSRGGCA